jgi:hypothetical protein
MTAQKTCIRLPRKIRKPKRWSAWSLLTRASIASVPPTPGVYQTRCVKEDGTPLPIPRAFDTDAEGTLAYGQTVSLRQRLTKMFNTLQPGAKRSTHAAMWTYLAFDYSRLAPRDRIEFRFQQTNNKSKAEDLESELLTDYHCRFLDLPPLNRKPGRDFATWENYIIARCPGASFLAY